jgi:hypothetical protein
VSGYRAIVQIYRLELRVPDRPLVAGASVGARVVTSGRTRATLTLELIQDGHVATLGRQLVTGNWDGAYDPLPKRAALQASITAAQLASLRPGPARLRATALGSSQWLRVPPPTIREIAVLIGPTGPSSRGLR